MNANTEFSGRIIEVDYERSTLLVRYEGAPPEIGSHLVPIAANGPEHTDWGRAALLWVLWHHQGGSSPTGQAVRFALGMGQFDRMTSDQVAQAKAFAPGIPGLAHTDHAGVALPREPKEPT